MIQKWTIEEFKSFVRERVDKYYWTNASVVVLTSFYLADVEKPIEVTIRQFEFLRAIAEKEILTYKSILNK
jgi:hypothetical protein